MLRDKNLIPLSRQHQHALAVCVRVERASPITESDMPAWRSEIAQIFQEEISVHFAAEEAILFPAARRFPGLVALVEELFGEHALLRNYFSRAEAGALTGVELRVFAETLSGHIRKEERQLFERMQEAMSPGELADLGLRLEDGLHNAVRACSVPNQSTKLRASK
jgi:iron-sulfur cluster repair protein YtfE (RIC family)